MGCSMSKLDDEEAVQLCNDRKKFIKEAVENRLKLASGHIAYIQAMKRVSAALREYIDGDEPREFALDSFTTPVKKSNFISITPFKSEQNSSSYKINYYKSGGNSSVSYEERPPHSPETFTVQSYNSYPNFGTDSVYSTPVDSSFFHYSPERPNYPPPSPRRSSQWDFFWNPFSSLDYYDYPNRRPIGNIMQDDDDLQQVREEEGIPELEEETEQEDNSDVTNRRAETVQPNVKPDRDEVMVEDDESDDIVEENESEEEDEEHETSEDECNEVAKAENACQVSKKETVVAECESKEEESTPGLFTVYVNKRPTSMAEVIKDLEDQFKTACNAANEFSSILEARRAQYSPSSNDHTAMKVLNPVALLKSASRSSSSRFAITTKDEGYESTSDESCEISGSHQSTLDRLYVWEKKLYQEVRTGERVRIAYEKKCEKLRNLDVKGEDPFHVHKIRAAIRDLHTQMKVSIHSVKAVSKRIETLRDEELEPQLLQMVKGLAKMWKIMAECHQLQKRTLDEAKILLAGTPSKLKHTKKYTIMSPSEPHRLARSAANLETELRNWRNSFESWIISQRSYMNALSSWLLRCIRPDPDASKSPFSPRRSAGAPPIFNICIQMSRFLNSVSEAPVLDGLDFFAAGVGSVYVNQLKEDSRSSKRFGGGEISGNMEVVEFGHDDEMMSAEKMAEIGIRVLCAGMSVAISSLTEFSVNSAKGYGDLAKQWDSSKQQERLNGTEK